MKQHLHVSSKSYRMPDAPSYVVLVWTHDDEDPRRYRVNAIGLELLRRGWTPEKIGLDPLDDEAEHRAEQEEARMDREQDR
jgi:hypothetical protein